MILCKSPGYLVEILMDVITKASRNRFSALYVCVCIQYFKKREIHSKPKITFKKYKIIVENKTNRVAEPISSLPSEWRRYEVLMSRFKQWAESKSFQLELWFGKVSCGKPAAHCHQKWKPLPLLSHAPWYGPNPVFSWLLVSQFRSYTGTKLNHYNKSTLLSP